MTHLILASLLFAAEPAPAAPLTLEQIVEKASADNLELAAAREKIVQADAQLAKAWAALLPVVTLSGAYTRNSDEALIALPDFRQPFTLAPDPASGGTYLIPGGLVEAVIQPKDQWGAMGKVMLPLLVLPAYAGIGAAEDGLLATEAAVGHARAELLFGVAQAYYGAVASQRLVELAQKQLASAEAQERLAAARVAAGQAPKIFALRAGVDRARAEQDLRRAQNAHAQAKLVLVQLCGLGADFTVVPPAPPVGADGIEEAEQLRAALEGRRDLVAARHGADAAAGGLDAAWWAFFPVLVGSGEYRWSNVEGFSGETTTWLLQLAAQWTLYDGGRYADLDLARSRLREAELTRDATVRKIEQEVKSARLELESARANLDKAREQERLAVDNLALVEAQAASGIATYLEATDAQTVRFAAGVGVVAEELNVHVAGLKLLKAGGRLFEAIPAG